MKTSELVEKVLKERNRLKEHVENAEGLVRLQEVMREYDGEDKLYSSEEIAEDLKDKPKVEGFKTGVVALDNLTGGFRQKQVITMFAHSGHGKTEVSTWIMSKLADLEPVLLPLEQNAEELISQRIERGYSIPHFLAPRHHDAFVGTDWIEERVVEGIAKYNSKMVVIDHLGYIDTNGKDGIHKRENLAYRIGQTMKELNHIADKWNVILLLLVHVSQGDEAKPPQLEDIGNSSDIKKESDTVIAIWRKNTMKKKVRVYENKVMLSVLKNRRFGKNGNVGLTFDDTTGNYYEDSSWVDSMVAMAEQAVEQDELFDSV